jgi:glycerol-3-phosphate cytidylyltransferase
MLKMEKQKCDYLKVALQVDPTADRPGLKNKPVQSIYERYAQVQACRYVDEILLYDTEKELLNLIMTQDMNIRFLSDEYLYRDFTGKQYCMDNGIELFYHKRQHSYSTSELRNRVYQQEKKRLEEKGIVDIPQYSTELLRKNND